MIRLTLTPYILEITTYGSNYGASYPRSSINVWPSVDFSASGTTVLDGPSYGPKFIWNFTANLLHADRLKLRRMLALWLSNKTNPWMLEDYTEELAETSPRTRALATGATESDDGTTTLYHAKYFAYPTQYPELSELNNASELLVLQFTEGGIFS